MRQALEGEPVRRFMQEDPVTVSPDLSLDDLVEQYVYRHHFKMYPVVEGDQLCGCVTTRQLQQVPRADWPNTIVRDISQGCSSDNVIGPDEDAMHALEQMNRTELSRLMVACDGHLVGVITLKDLLGFLSLKIELESPNAASKFTRQLLLP
jgi:predicted transcriptional regulator